MSSNKLAQALELAAKCLHEINETVTDVSDTLDAVNEALPAHEAEKQAGRVAVVNDDDPHAILSAALRIMPNTSTLKSEEQAEDIVAVWRAAVASIQCTAVTAPPSTLSEQDKEDAELTDEKIDALLFQLNEVAGGDVVCDYGLPLTWRRDELRQAVRNALRADSEKKCTEQKNPHHDLDLSTVRKALERNRSIIEPNTLYLSWVELDALYRIVGINKE